MKIAYVGNFTQQHCTEVHIGQSLENLGHEVTRIQENPINAPGFLEKVEKHDMLLFTRTWNNLITMDHLKKLKSLGIPTVSYHLDLYVGLKREDGLDTDPFWRTEYVFSPDGDPKSAEVFKRKGINHFWSAPAVFKPECYLTDDYGKFDKDVVFVGGGVGYGHKEWPYRGQLVRWLERTYGKRYKKFGYPEQTVRNHELNKLYCTSKVVVGDSLCLGFKHEKYWSDRIMETTGRGGFIIHPYILGLEEFFENGEEVVFYQYGNFDDLKEKIDYYLDPANEYERERIRLAGQARTLKDHTYNNRLSKMIEIVTEIV